MDHVPKIFLAAQSAPVIPDPHRIETLLLHVLIQLAIIIAVARIFHMLFRRLGQPGVVGEIAAGLLLGPSAFGKLEAAGLVPLIFDPSNRAERDVFSVLSQLGLVLLLFLVGLEFDFSHLRRRGHSAMLISITGIIIPLAGGIGLGFFMHAHLANPPPRQAFVLFMGTAMCITALPVLGRMMMEMGISRTELSAVTIAAAAMEDACGWIMLAAVSALATAKFHPGDSVRMLGLSLAFALGVIFVVRPVVMRLIARVLRANDHDIRNAGENGTFQGPRRLSPAALSALLVILLLCAIATSLIGIFAIFGAFILGASLSGHQPFRQAIHRVMGEFVAVFFLPLFFAYTGLRTDIGSLSGGGWLMALAVIAVAVVAKFGGCRLAARLSGFNLRESACVGAMMNTRGLMELVVINVGYELHVIPASVFCMLVLMALATTLMTTPLLRLFMGGTELEAGMVANGFAPARGRASAS